MTRLKTISKIILAVLFIASGFNHFFNPEIYLPIMPPYLPAHRFLIYLSGAFEFIFGLLLLIPKWRTLGAWGILLLLVAFFPVHMYMAFNTARFAEIPSAFLWLRLLLQLVFIAWAYWHTREKTSPGLNWKK